MPDLTNSNGQMVNAVYGFFSMFLHLLHELKPDYLIVCFDRSKPTVRQSMFAGYHEHRPPMASELSAQIALIDELLEKMGVKVSFAEGFEGDDLIGTFAKQAEDQDPEMEVIIVTGDRDMLQLVNKRTKVLMTVTGITKTLLFDESLVEEKYGIKPSQLVDYKALIGDPSDGYPGISGIGPKTAVSLLRQFGSFEEIYEHISEIPEKIAIKLATDAEQGALAKKLATIITDAPVRLRLEDCQVANFAMEKLREGFEEHHFKSLIARLDARYPYIGKKTMEKTPAKDGQMELL